MKFAQIDRCLKQENQDILQRAGMIIITLLRTLRVIGPSHIVIDTCSLL